MYSNMMFILQGAEARDNYMADIKKGAIATYDVITHAIYNKQPLLVGKMGNTEYNQVSRWFNAGRGTRMYNIDENICRHSGVCPLTIGTVNKFATLYTAATREIDVHFRWHVSMDSGHKVDQILFPKNQIIVNNLMSLDPWFFTKPYSASFAGKTVLVVSTHAEYIRQQYLRNRTCIFKGRSDILPEFTLKTVTTPLPPAPEDSSLLFNDTLYTWPTWEEVLQSIKVKVLQQGDFDVMLIAAGSFSIPVAVEAKHKGKVAIILGGTMNPFFGLRSARYDSMLHYRSLIYTDCFLRMPKPAGAKYMENNAYW
jgi:hypothetical protein